MVRATLNYKELCKDFERFKADYANRKLQGRRILQSPQYQGKKKAPNIELSVQN
jgi:hypothetical protein